MMCMYVRVWDHYVCNIDDQKPMTVQCVYAE
jgi:hypothetical protein